MEQLLKIAEQAAAKVKGADAASKDVEAYREKSVVNTQAEPGLHSVEGCPILKDPILDKSCKKSPLLPNYFAQGYLGDNIEAQSTHLVDNDEGMFYLWEEWTGGTIADAWEKGTLQEKKNDRIQINRVKLMARCRVSDEEICDSRIDWLGRMEERFTEQLNRQIENVIINWDPRADDTNINAYGAFAGNENQAFAGAWKGLRYHGLVATQGYDAATQSYFGDVDLPNSEGYLHIPEAISPNCVDLGGLFTENDICKVTSLLGCSSEDEEGAVLIVPRKVKAQMRKFDCLKCKDTATTDATLFGARLESIWGHDVYESRYLTDSTANGVIDGKDPTANDSCSIIAVDPNCVYRGFGCGGAQYYVTQVPGCGYDFIMCAYFGFGIADGHAMTGRSVAMWKNIKVS